MSDPFRTKGKFKELTESFDKDFIVEIFEAALAEGIIPPNNITEHVQYKYNGFLYTLQRININRYMQAAAKQAPKQAPRRF